MSVLVVGDGILWTFHGRAGQDGGGDRRRGEWRLRRVAIAVMEAVVTEVTECSGDEKREAERGDLIS